jgi:hypothetical protein
MSLPAGFMVTTERVNAEEAAAGDTDRREVLESAVSLRDAFDAARRAVPAASQTRACHADFIPRPNSVTATHELFTDGDELSVTIHFPTFTTTASRRRLARLLVDSRRYSLG